MPAPTVTSFTAFANLLVAACRLAADGAPADRTATLAGIASGARPLDAALGTTGLAAVAAEMARTAEDHALYFTHPGFARDDAIAVFWQVAPAAFADPVVFAAAHLDPALTAERMTAAVRSGPHARDFREAVLAEPFFRTVAEAMLKVMHARAETVPALNPALWPGSP